MPNRPGDEQRGARPPGNRAEGPPAPGARVGPFELLSLLGAGGMGTVYLARDTTLDREVALKFLSPELTHDPERLARFEREARVLASINHPNIATVYGFESGDASSDPGGRALVMELVDGETLAERIARGVEGAASRIGPDEMLDLARQIACGLEAAHAKGIVHRDLKPANIKIRCDGTVKVLDFGLARPLAWPGAGSATTALDATRQGVVLGTAPYMSPEQARGQVLDFRTDVWAFGCVVYEMLTGRAPFSRATFTDTLAAILTDEPDWTALPSGTPTALCHVLRRCLEKDPARRLADIPEARIRIEEIAAAGLAPGGGGAEADPAAGRPRRTVLGLAAVTGLLALVLAAGWLLRGFLPVGNDAAVTLAVLPFANRSDNPDHAYLAQGLADALIADLLDVPDVRVVSRASVMRYAAAAGMATMAGGMALMNDMEATGSAESAGGETDAADGMGAMGPQKPLPEIAHDLDADVLLHGTLAREGDRVTVTASLIQMEPLQNLWNRTFARPAGEMLALQRDLVDAITGSIGATVRTGDSESPATGHQYDPAAHDAYLKGAYYQAHWKLSQAVESFTRAVEIDPSHAAAQAGLARAYYFLGFFGDLPSSVALAGMRRAATLALEHNPSMADAHAQLALVKMLQDWDWEGAEQSFRQALQLSPANAQIRHDYAHFLLGQGRRRESMEQAARAVALDPVNPMLISCLGWHHLFDARYEEAARLAAEAAELMPDYWAEVVHGWSLLGLGDHDAAVIHMREAIRLKETPFTLAALAHALAITSREIEARETLNALLRRADSEYVSPYDVATIYAGLGEADHAFRWLRRAADERSLFIVHVGWDFRLDPLRGDERLAQLAAQELRLPAPQFAALKAEDRRGM